MSGIIGRDENSKPIYASPDKVLELDIQREKAAFKAKHKKNHAIYGEKK